MKNLYDILEVPRVPDALVESILLAPGVWDAKCVGNLAADLRDTRAALRERTKVWWLTPIAVIVIVINIVLIFWR